MILQELLFPNFDTCATHDMYFKAPGTHFMEATPFVPEKADFIRFDQKISKQAYWESVFGPTEKVRGSENDLFAAAEALKKSGKPLPEIYMWCGTSDFLYDQNVRMREHLKKLGYNLTYTECPGDHQWKYWDEHIQLGLNWLTK